MTEEKPKKSVFGRIEAIISIALVIFFLMWAIPKCQSDKGPKKESEPVVETEEVATNISTIYIVVDSLNMRTEPRLNSAIMAKLPMGTSVFYLNQHTDFTQRIFMNEVMQEAPWVKIRTREGQEGWIYAAAAQFYPIVED